MAVRRRHTATTPIELALANIDRMRELSKRDFERQMDKLDRDEAKLLGLNHEKEKPK